MNGEEYRLVTRRLRGLLGTGQVWLGADHVLLVDERIITQQYRRFYLRDIEALVIGRTNTVWVLMGVTLAVLTLVATLFVGSSGVSSDYPGAFTGVFLAIGAAVVLYNAIAGPTCRMQIQTKVGAYTLAFRPRVRLARRIMASLAPAISEAQEASSTLVGQVGEP